MLKAAKILLFAALLIFSATVVFGQKRSVVGKTLISDALPKIKVKLKGDFRYVGKFDFRIRDVAAGERYVFVEADRNKRIRRLFIAQFEGFLPGVAQTYNYRFDDALKFGAHKFRQNTYAYSNEESERENPQNEGALTAKFLREKGYKFEDEFMMSRFVTVPDAERRHELILFYIENVGPTGRRVSDFYRGDDETEIWREISAGLTERSLKAFEIQ
jgi:hypothetical protein